MRLLLAIPLVVLAFALPVSPSAAEINERVKPWDEGPQDPSFLKFRNELKDIVARKDAAALMKVVAANIKNSFGGDDGAVKFRRGWKPEDPNSAIWPALSLVVDQGGNFDSKTSFSAPCAFSAFPSDVDGFDKIVVTQEGAVLRAKPNADAPVVRTLDHDILAFAGGPPKPQHEARPEDWIEAKDAKGAHGFVLAQQVRSPIDYRAQFQRSRGRWLIVSFLAGD